MGKTGATVGCDKAVAWVRTEGATTTYSTTPLNMDKKIIAVTYNPEIATGSIDASDVQADTDKAKTGAGIDINVIDLTSAERVAFFGETLENGTNVEGGNDIFPYLVIAYGAKRSDGKYNLYKIVKCMLEPTSETVETIKKGSINYQTTKIKGTADADGDDKDIRYTRYGVDPVADAAIITAWFADADYYAPVV